jgi:hypothetical protein
MRSFVVLSLLVICFSGYSQIINFPDPNFKNALLNTDCTEINGDFQDADINNDGEITVDEAIQCSILSVSSRNIKNLEGIEHFINLKNLLCNINQIVVLDVKMLTKLEELNCYGNKLTNLDVRGLTNLKYLFCGSNQLTSLDVQGLTNLTELTVLLNKLTFLDVQGLTNLTELTCENNQITSLSVQGLSNLERLNCAGNKLASLEVQGLTNLTSFNCGNNQLTSLDAQGFTKMLLFYCFNNKLTTLNIKGIKINSYVSFFGNPNLKYICCDEEKITVIKSNAITNGQNCEVNSYCSFLPGGKYFTVKGNSIYDSNKNGCDDLDDLIPDFKYNIANGMAMGTILSNKSGSFFIPFQVGTHSITPQLENPDFFEVSPTSFTTTFPSNSDTIIQNFCITAKDPFRKVAISVIPLTPPARPGFDAQYKIIWENKGNLLENGTIHFTYDENIFDYVSADETPDAINNGKLSWDYTDLLPFEKREIIVTLNLNSPMENPPVNAGDITYLYANILDNVFRLENVIVGSYDPNDKTCLQGQYFHPDSVGKYVNFLIRFENTGNFAAENVVIKDIIDDKTFDMPSLLITDASHEVYTRIAANKVEFIFENIQLPFEDETNDGYVAFKIKTKSTLKLGDEMKNLADIYFDYNFPIRTNETQTTIAIPTSTKDFNAEVTIHPNPVRDVLTLDSSSRWTKAEIFDISGRIVKVTGVDGFSVDVIGLDSGTYILHLSDKDKRGRVKFVKM